MRLVAILVALCGCAGSPRRPPRLAGIPLLFSQHGNQIQPDLNAIDAASFQFLLGNKWIAPTLTTRPIHNGILVKGTFGHDGRIVVTRIGNTVTAIAREGADGFEIAPGAGGHRLVQRGWRSTGARRPSLHGAAWDALAAKRGTPPPTPVSNAPVSIDVVFAYTPKVGAKRSDDGMWELAEMSIEDLNDACASSGAANVTFRVADVVATEDNEAGTMDVILYYLRHDKTKFKKAHDARAAAGADLLVLFVDSKDGALGLAPIMAETPEDGAAVVYHDSTLWYLTVPHEIGHILGALHDNEKRDEPYKFGHAFVDDETQHVRTIMSESCAVPEKCPLVVRWSAPKIDPGDPEYGDKTWRDNAKVMRFSAPFISHLGTPPSPP